MPSDVVLLREFLEAIGAKRRILEGEGEVKRSLDLLYSDNFEELYYPSDFMVNPKHLDFAGFDPDFNLVALDLQMLPTDRNFNDEILPRFQRLWSLGIGSYNNFERLEKDFFYDVANLEELSFEQIELDSLSIDLSRNPNLKKLSFRGIETDNLNVDLSKNIDLRRLSFINFINFITKNLDIKFPEKHTLQSLTVDDLDNDEFYKLTRNLEKITYLRYFGNKLILDKKFFDYLINKKVFKFSTKTDPTRDTMFLDKLGMFSFRSRRFAGKWEFFNDEMSPFQ